MTSKTRAKFRAEANSLNAIFQIGKDGLSENLLQQLSDALDKRELIKVRVLLESAKEKPEYYANKISDALKADIIQVIGGVIVLYRKSEKKKGKKKK